MAAEAKTVATFLVTGGNDGLGFEVVKQLAAVGKVFLGCRSKEKGNAAREKLAEALKHQVTVVQIDSTNEESVKAAVATITAAGGLDVLINNAGLGNLDKTALQKPGTCDLSVIQSCMDTNFYGTIRVTNAMLPLLNASGRAGIVFVSSDMASTTLMATTVGNPQSPLNHVHFVAYNTSKAALNSYVVAMAASFPKIKMNSVTPGYTATKLNGFGHGAPGAKTPDVGAGIIAKYAILGDDTPTGKFISFNGELGW
jgi:NAD(P)-dependent dehydrogenase (short-subunit alcohol dehydrogenase family)